MLLVLRSRPASVTVFRRGPPRPCRKLVVTCASTRMLGMWFHTTPPTSKCSNACQALSMSCVNTPACSPYLLSFTLRHPHVSAKIRGHPACTASPCGCAVSTALSGLSGQLLICRMCITDSSNPVTLAAPTKYERFAKGNGTRATLHICWQVMLYTRLLVITTKISALRSFYERRDRVR